MDRKASRPTSRFAVRALAWAALPVMLVAGCSSDSGDDTTDDEPAPSASPTPDPVRFATLPEPCSTVGEETVGETVPEADPAAGETLSSSDTSASGACLWSGLDDYQFRSLTVALRRFDSDLSIGSGDERAGEYLQQMAEEVSGDDANRDVESAELAETGDAAVTMGYSVTKESEDGEQDYRQHRVVARTGNVVVTVDYSGAGFEGDDMPGADSVREAAETAAREAVAAVDATEGAANDEGGEEQQEQEEQQEADGGQGDEPPSNDDL
ncbi:DUF3558 domain-containing protein [Streptomyces johnsoniae]|uniref:DUF3558 domain-containing protein n=1 Tax=Streptomyces johnsoniae TaxID=3075532 RepID=A0ABU2S3F0_9ACTN|nr:DUF3558 domain-containing protein [Streptomyces sp. DSM 41886]MDT0442125.1 DUF3558 domain-containing protein [Streptomyces sp. DSM 41886]